MSKPKHTIEALIKARAGSINSVEFIIPLDSSNPEEGVAAKLSMPDISAIKREQTLIYEKEFAVCKRKGMGDEKPNMDAWNDEVKAYDKRVEQELAEMESNGATRQQIETRKKSAQQTRTALYSDPPKSLAAQVARRLSFSSTGIELVPEFLKDPQTNEKLFKDSAQLETFKEVVKSDAGLITLMTEQFAKLANMKEQASEDAKN